MAFSFILRQFDSSQVQTYNVNKKREIMFNRLQRKYLEILFKYIIKNNALNFKQII